MSRQHFLPITLAMMCAAATVGGAGPADEHQKAAAIVEGIRRADYEGDRSTLRRLHDELKALRSDDRKLAARLRYWQGFALWRRALNGFNDSAGPEELQRDLEAAIPEFQASLGFDPAFADAKLGVISCLGNLLYLQRSDPAKVKELFPRMQKLTTEASAAAPENPRLHWVLGPQLWWTPPERGGGAAAAAAAYEKGLQLARSGKGTSADPLDPSWGEPELLMNLAWTRLNQPAPEVAKAEEYARQALRLVPHWRYLRDVLMPQILEAKRRN